MTICHPFLFLFFCSSPLLAQFDFEDAKIQDTYKSIINLETSKSKSLLIELNDTSKYDANGIVPLLENYLDIISLLTTENKELYKRLKPNENSRIKRIKQLDQNSPYYLYTMADIKLQWAFVELIFEDYINGFLDLKKANDLIDRNIKRHPGFTLNNKVKGLIDLLTEATPETANLALFAAGLSRSTEGNQKLIKTSVFEPLFKDEINIYLSFVNTYVKRQPELGLFKIKKTYNANPSNLFAQFTYANILSQLGENQEVINLLNTNKLHTDSNYLYIPYLDYLLGESEMNLGHIPESKMAFSHFLMKSSNGTFKANSAYKLALLYASTNESESSKSYLEKIKTFEMNDFYLDEYAHFVSNHTTEINPTLAKATLSYDAKNYLKTYQLLLPSIDFSNKNWTTEKYYKLASSAYKLGKKEEAKLYYQKSIDSSNKNDYNHFGSFSCIKLGYIIHSENRIDEARVLYKKAKLYKNHFYVSSIKEQADYKLNQIGK